MSKVYSNKALPPGTVLREWRLEEVLGVGGFGIVYKARGIYFDELVAIKEYFPSSISERQEDATIVPVDSDAEEVHALGLKKFVEEAKLLWNLSTPSRHPNIVSVRSLFEIHGSAYMVMDFEDGVSLSRLLKEGRRFNEASLTALIRPIAEGLERAHRVGVLHRDIKPPNILVGHDNRPVLIDFGSARFESGDATSTSVTFHTPPYAAIEQYVKTYEQGPWTDIYALGVVLYECVAGEKPAEVLERLHGNADRRLSDGDWPGFSKSFLAAVDAAMTIRPDERPRSISEWLALFDRPESALPPPPEDDENLTRISKFAATSDAIKPVAPPAPGFETSARLRTAVPDTPSKAEFTSAGMNTRGAKAAPESPAPEPAPVLPSDQAQAASGTPATAIAPQQVPPAPPAAKRGKPAAAAKPAKSGGKKPLLYLGMAAAAIAIGTGGWYVLGNRAPQTAAPTPQAAAPESVAPASLAPPVEASAASTMGADIAALADEARRSGIPAAAADGLAAAATAITTLEADLGRLGGDAAAAQAKRTEIDAVAKPALVAFTGAVASDVGAKASRTYRQLPWTDPRRRDAAAGASARHRQIAAALLRSRNGVAGAAAGIAQAATGSDALVYARQALVAAQGHSAALANAYRAGPAGGAATQSPAGADFPQGLPAASPDAAPAPRAPETAAQGSGVSAATLREFNSVVTSARGLAREVISLGDRSRPGPGASEAEKAGYRTRHQNAQSAQTYQAYLNTLSRSMEATRSEAEARQSVAKARQTLSYLTTILAGSRASLR